MAEWERIIDSLSQYQQDKIEEQIADWVFYRCKDHPTATAEQFICPKCGKKLTPNGVMKKASS